MQGDLENESKTLINVIFEDVFAFLDVKQKSESTLKKKNIYKHPGRNIDEV